MGLQMDINDRTLVAALVGELDYHQAERLRVQIDTAYDKSACRNMILNMAEVTFMDSSGIGMIIGRYKHVEMRGGKLVLAGMNEHVTKLYEISGLAKIIAKSASVDDAKMNISNGFGGN